MGRLIDEQLWASLESAPKGQGLVRKRVAPDAPVDLFAAVEKPQGVRVLLVALASDDLAMALDVPEARGIVIKAVPSGDGPGWGFAEVRLIDRRYEEVFTTLTDDLAEHVAGATDPKSSIDRLADRLRRWESFLKVVEPEGLGAERRAGLYGELDVLREQLLPISPELAVDAWVGPDNAQQDFQGNGWALEVKTSRTKEPIAVRISGERQLDDGGLTFLGLAHVGLEQRRNSGETLPGIVASIRARLSHTPMAEEFEGRLIAAGYSALHEPHYLADGYTVRFRTLFRVSLGFPRIVEGDLVDGVGDVAYSVAIPALGTFAMEWSELRDLIPRDYGDQ